MKRTIQMACGILSLATLSVAQTGSWESLIAQADAADRAGDFAAAAQCLKSALAVARERPDARMSQTLNALGNLDNELGQYEEAQRMHLRALSFIAANQGKQTIDYATVEENLAVSHSDHGDEAEALRLIRHAIAIYETLLPAGDMRLYAARGAMGKILLTRGSVAEAERLLVPVVEVFRAHPDSEGIQFAIALNNLAVLRQHQRRLPESAALLEEAVGAVTAGLGSGHPFLLRLLMNLASIYGWESRPDDAERLFHRTVTLASERLGTNHPMYGTALLAYANFLRQSGRKAEAKTMEARGRAVLRDSATANGRGLTVDAAAFRER